MTINYHKQCRDDLAHAQRLNLIDIPRWEEGIDHHPESERAIRFLAEHDFYHGGDSLQIQVGGDGDNGEEMMYGLDVYFEMRDAIDVPTFTMSHHQVDAIFAQYDFKPDDYSTMVAQKLFEAAGITLKIE